MTDIKIIPIETLTNKKKLIEYLLQRQPMPIQEEREYQEMLAKIDEELKKYEITTPMF